MTVSVTIITRTEASETVPFLQKLKRPALRILLNLVLKSAVSIIKLFSEIFPALIVAHHLALVHGNDALAE